MLKHVVSRIFNRRVVRHACRAAGLAAIVAANFAGDCDGTEPDAIGFSAVLNNQQPITVSPGSSIALSVTITRLNGFTGAVQVVHGSGGPPGTSSNQLIIPEGSNTGTVTLNIPANAPLGPTTITMRVHADGYHSADVDVSFNISAGGTFALNVPASLPAVAAGATFNIPITIARTQFTDPVSITVTPRSEYTTTITQPGTGTTGNVAVAVGGSVPPSNYSIEIKASGPGGSQVQTKTLTFAVAVSNAGYTLNMTSPSLSMSPGSSQTNTVNIVRSTYTGNVAITAAADDPEIIVTPTPASTSGNSVALAITVSASVSARTHVVTVTGAPGTPAVTTTFNIVVGFGTAGPPVALILIPAPAAGMHPGGAQEFTAFLIDAAGNRALPEAGMSIGMAVTNSSVADFSPALPAFDSNERWRRGTIVAKALPAGQTSASTVLTAFYANASGQTTFSRTVTISVTP